MKKAPALTHFFLSVAFLWSQTAPKPADTAAAAPARLAMETAFADSTSSLERPALMAQLAAVSPVYVVTPGDVYTLAYSISAQPSSLDAMVQSDGSVNLGPLGVLSGWDLRFQDFKLQLERRVSSAYPGSAPQVLIKSVGTFVIRIEGEVAAAGERQAWGMTRLSEIFQAERLPTSSDRSVSLRSADGRSRSFDLFRALRLGESSQDPVLRPGDVVRITRSERRLTVKGAVYRPGTYELLPSEGLHEAVTILAGGLLGTARADLAVLSSPARSGAVVGERRFIDLGSGLLPSIRPDDELYVPSSAEYVPVVYFEGAVRAGGELAAQFATDRVPFFAGDRLSNALRLVAARLSPQADLRRAFLARRGEADTIPVDLERLLYAYDPAIDIELKAEDRIVIPQGSLDVFVTGEVTASSWVNVQALSRLSTTVKPFLTRYASLRDIRVRRDDGTEGHYDLFRAERYGDLSQDPYLRPGDRVVVGRIVSLATISGEVRRPGTYQLLAGEGLRELIEIYADGFTERANPQRISLVRSLSDSSPVGEKTYVDYLATSSKAVRLYDAYSVPPMTEYLPVAWFEGALGVGVNGEDPQAAKRFPYTFYPGELLSQAVQAQRKQFSAVSDLEKAYVKRGAERIPVDLSKFLYAKDFSGDLALAAGDEVIVPFRQFFVSVSGAVKLPGRYPYVPDRDWRYYVRLAGGFDADKNAGEKVDVRDQEGRRVAVEGRAMQPEDSIEAASNDFLYGFGKVASILTTVISIASLVISLLR